MREETLNNAHIGNSGYIAHFLSVDVTPWSILSLGMHGYATNLNANTQ
jgi:hypothetical protein